LAIFVSKRLKSDKLTDCKIRTDKNRLSNETQTKHKHKQTDWRNFLFQVPDTSDSASAKSTSAWPFEFARELRIIGWLLLSLIVCLAVALMVASGVQCSATVCPVLPKGSVYIGGELGEAAFAMGHWGVNEIVSGFGDCER
jgi:hypothetical protein